MKLTTNNDTPRELITVVVVNYNTSRFVEIGLEALIALTRNKYKVVVCDNGSSRSDKRNLKRIVSKYDNIELVFREQSAPGGIGHGEALNILVDKIETPYGVVLDSDAVFLKKAWDEIIINRLDDKVKIIGTPRIQKKKEPFDFPSVFATLFDNNVFKSLGIDMRPANIQAGQDTGWEMREKFLKGGYKCEIMEARNTREYKGGPFRNTICAEYYLKGYKDVFACHFSRGSSLGAAKYKEWSRLLQLPYINLMAKKIKGYRERKEWLAICKDIINRQAGQ